MFQVLYIFFIVLTNVVGRMARKEAAKKRAAVMMAADKMKRFILTRVMTYVHKIRAATKIQAASRSCLQRRRFAEQKLAVTIVSYFRDCRPQLLEASWEVSLWCCWRSRVATFHVCELMGYLVCLCGPDVETACWIDE